jgi:single-stranded-DNA-specific exonuclease
VLVFDPGRAHREKPHRRKCLCYRSAKLKGVPIFDDWVLAEAAPAVGTRLPIRHSTLHDIFTRRGVTAGEEYRRFTVPTTSDLHDPQSIHGIDYACERIRRAVRDREAILIYGDYDVDGITSIVLLQTVLRMMGAEVGFVVPHRLVDGYGLKMEVLERVLETRNVRLVITVDCGITSVEPVQRAIERGIDVIITDHHLPPELLPEAAAVLNPKQPGCEYPFKELAGVGVVFKLCCELIRRAGRTIATDSLIKIAALGTIADVAPLEGENRTICSIGLRGLSDPRNPGLRALLRHLGLLGRPLRASDVGFRVGPRLNAAGRLASANTAIELFAAASETTALPMVAELERMNAERQQIELLVRRAAEEQITGEERILILAGEGWHKGVLGLSAGRIAQRYHRAALVIAIEGDRCVGSGRSTPLINLHRQLAAVAHLFTHFGGHEFACGFSLETKNLAELRRCLAVGAECIPQESLARAITVDGVVEASEIDSAFYDDHELLQPFGAGNRQPTLLVREAVVRERRDFAPQCSGLTISTGSRRLPAVLWPSVESISSALQIGETADLLFRLEPDRYADEGYRLEIIDARPPGLPLRNERDGASVAAATS